MRWYLVWAGCALMATVGVLAVRFQLRVNGGFGYDSHAYWLAAQRLDSLYGTRPLAKDAYLYSPLFAQLVWPLARLPAGVFIACWSLLEAVAFAWLLAPLRGKVHACAAVGCLAEIMAGNIYALMAVALVLGARRGPPWLLLGLTKVVGGAVGLLWLVAARRWSALLRGGLVGGVLVGVSVAAAPEQWRSWFTFLTTTEPEPGDVIVLPSSVVVLVAVGLIGLVLWGGITGRAWVLVPAVVLLSPTLGPNTLTLLAALPRLSGVRVRGSDQRTPVGGPTGGVSSSQPS